MQDITQKLLESVTLIAGSSLEQTTWLRRTYAVKPGRQSEVAEGDEAEGEGPEPEPEPERRATLAAAAAAAAAKVKEASAASNSKYSVHALTLLSELTAPMLDVVYSSEEKDKVVPFLATLLHNVFPYLRHHRSVPVSSGP